MHSLLFSARRPTVILTVVAILGLASHGAAGARGDNVLLNPGFETDAVLNQEPLPFITDWTVAGGGINSTASAPVNPVRTGVGSMQQVGAGGFGVPVAYQPIPATAGQTWDFQGFIRTEEALTLGTRALIKIVWHDANTLADLPPAAINIGIADAEPFFGIIPAVQFTSASAPGEWHPFHIQGVAPANTTEVRFFGILVDETPATVYYDDFQAELVEAGTPGDFDGDGDVDAEDLDDWIGAFATTDAGDADGDGDSDGADFLVWQRGLNEPAATPQLGAVPEPGAVALALVGTALVIGAMRRQGTQR